MGMMSHLVEPPKIKMEEYPLHHNLVRWEFGDKFCTTGIDQSQETGIMPVHCVATCKVAPEGNDGHVLKQSKLRQRIKADLKNRGYVPVAWHRVMWPHMSRQ